MPQKSPGSRRNKADDHLGGLLGGLTEFIEKLGDLAEKGQALRESGEFRDPSDTVRGVYGFSIRTASVGGESSNFKVEPFGNIHRDEKTGKTTVAETLEPMVDIFEEPDHLLVVAELPGIGKDDVKLEVEQDTLTISAARGKKRYRKVVQLPSRHTAEQMSFICRNGVLEVKFDLSQASDD